MMSQFFLSCDKWTVSPMNRRLLWNVPSWKILERALRIDKMSMNLHFSLAGQTFAACVGIVWHTRLPPLVSAMLQLNLEGLGFLYKL